MVAALTLRAKPFVYTTYRAIGTSGGRVEFMGNTTSSSYPHFGSSGLPLPTEDFNALQSAGGVLHVPFITGKIGIYHSVAKADGSQQASPCGTR